MNIVCENCNAKLTIADHKIPRDRDATLKCPKCNGKIKVPASGTAAGNLPQAFGNRMNALLCIGDEHLGARVFSTVRDLQFNIAEAANFREALKTMEYHIYHLVIIDDSFDQNTGLQALLESINTLDMSLRRRICLVLISLEYATSDYMAALHLSVNNIINKNDIMAFENYLPSILEDHTNFYTVYNESMKITGKA